MKVHDQAPKDADSVLNHNQDRADQEEDKKPGTSFLEHPGIRSEADCCKEHEKQGILQAHVEGKSYVEQAIHQGQNNSYQASPNNRRWYAEAFEHGYPADQGTTHKEDRNRDEKGVNQIQFYRFHLDNSFGSKKGARVAPSPKSSAGTSTF
jgi:hypothetical protein